jgi:hypothetical protein
MSFWHQLIRAELALFTTLYGVTSLKRGADAWTHFRVAPAHVSPGRPAILSLSRASRAF